MFFYLFALFFCCLSTHAAVTEYFGPGSYKDGERAWYFKTYDGTAEATFDDKGNTMGAHRYAAFGKQISDVGEACNRQAFQGQDFDTIANHYNLGMRQMRGDDGQWNAPEPLLITGEARLGSPYRYAANKPTVLTDPTGLDPDSAELAAYCKSHPCISEGSPDDASEPSLEDSGFLGSQAQRNRWSFNPLENEVKTRLSWAHYRSRLALDRLMELSIERVHQIETGADLGLIDKQILAAQQEYASAERYVRLCNEEIFSEFAGRGLTSDELFDWNSELRIEFGRTTLSGRPASELMRRNARSEGKEGPGGANMVLMADFIFETTLQNPCTRASIREGYPNFFEFFSSFGYAGIDPFQDMIDCAYPPH